MGRNSWCGWPTVVAVSHTFHIAGNHATWLLMMHVSHFMVCLGVGFWRVKTIF